MAKWFMLLTLLAVTALSSIGCAVGCYVANEDDDNDVNTYLEFKYDGWWVTFSGGQDYDTPEDDDLIRGWYDTTTSYEWTIYAYNSTKSEYFRFNLYDIGSDLDVYTVGAGDVYILYHYNGKDYEPTGGYVELIDIDGTGGEIEGYFGGYFFDTDLVDPEPDVLITDGYFKALRISDR